MDAELKAKWVAALRGGEYEQGFGRLRRISANNFCCLGVLCDLMRPQDWNPDKSGDIYRMDGMGGALPISVMEASKLSPSHVWELAKMNDEGLTFGVIAGFIEANC